MTLATPGLGSALAGALAEIHLDPGALRAGLGDTVLEADDAKEMTNVLARALYEHLHAARPPLDGVGPVSFRDRTFEAALSVATPHLTTRTPVVLLPDAADDPQRVVARIGDVRVALPRTVPLDTTGHPTMADLPAARPALSPGFFLVDSPEPARRQGQILRVYLHLRQPDVACAVWHRVLSALNDRGIGYRAKIGSSPLLYPRRDAMVVYLWASAWSAATVIRDAAVAGGDLGEETSPFAYALAPGVGVAWEPSDDRPGYATMSFGEHRSRVVAEGLVAHATATGPRTEFLRAALVAASVDPDMPARNTTSPDLTDIGLTASLPAEMRLR